MSHASSIPDRIIWVSANGDDGNSGARDAPLHSIQLAIDRATPGTAILLLPGEYSGNFEFEKIQGTTEKPIWLAAADGPGTVTITAASNAEAVITIQGEDSSSATSFWLAVTTASRSASSVPTAIRQ